MTPEGPVIITTREIYNELRALASRVGDLSHKMDGLPETLSDQEQRLRTVESRVWVASGVVAVVSASAAIVIPMLVR